MNKRLAVSGTLFCVSRNLWFGETRAQKGPAFRRPATSMGGQQSRAGASVDYLTAHAQITQKFITPRKVSSPPSHVTPTKMMQSGEPSLARSQPKPKWAGGTLVRKPNSNDPGKLETTWVPNPEASTAVTTMPKKQIQLPPVTPVAIIQPDAVEEGYSQLLEEGEGIAVTDTHQISFKPAPSSTAQRTVLIVLLVLTGLFFLTPVAPLLFAEVAFVGGGFIAVMLLYHLAKWLCATPTFHDR